MAPPHAPARPRRGREPDASSDRHVWPRLALAAAAGGMLGLAVLLFPLTGGDPRPPRLLLSGRELPPTPEAADRAVAWAEQHLTGGFDLVLPGGELHRVTSSELGVELERQRLRHMVLAAQRSWGRAARSTALELLLPVRLDRERALSVLLAIKAKEDRDPLDARLDVDLGAVTAERAGRALDVDRSLLAIERALENGASRAQLAFLTRPPRRLASELAGVRHDVLLGAYQAAYDTTARAEDRAFNLRLIASRLDGHVMLPGAELSFHAVVGPGDDSGGFRVGEGSAPGRPAADGLDSHCQMAGILHAAGSFAGLEIIERHPLSRPTLEVGLGLEAAVEYPSRDLRLRNPYDFAVVLHASAVAGQARIEIRGAQRPYTVTLLLVIERATPFERFEQSDDSLPFGLRRLAQRGVPGLELHRYRIKRDGPHARREVDIHHYPPTPEIVLVGAGQHTAAGRPPEAVAPEPRVDELVVLSQNPRDDRPPVERRIAGRFGPGWAKKVGEPAPEQRAASSPGPLPALP